MIIKHSMDWFKRNFTVLVPPPSWWHGASCHGTFPGTWTLLIRQRSDVWLAATLTTDWWSRDTFWCGGLNCWVVLLMLVLGASSVYLAVLPELSRNPGYSGWSLCLWLWMYWPAFRVQYHVWGRWPTLRTLPSPRFLDLSCCRGAGRLESFPCGVLQVEAKHSPALRLTIPRDVPMAWNTVWCQFFSWQATLSWPFLLCLVSVSQAICLLSQVLWGWSCPSPAGALMIIL